MTQAPKTQASSQNPKDQQRAHSASAQDERGSGSASPSESELIKKTDLNKKIQEAKKKAEKEEKTEEAAQNTFSETETKLRNELSQMTEMAKRTMADLHNLKRRQEEDRRLIITMANVDIILGLLPILNNLERSKRHLPENFLKNEKNKEWWQGIEMCITQFQKVLTEAGLKPIESIGQPFNPDLHEALIQSPGPQNIILEELEKGYMLGERVIRHAKVKVGNGEKNEMEQSPK